MNTDNYINLGKTGIKVSAVGLGTMQWGDVKMPDNHADQPEQSVREIYLVSRDMGINLFDTAEMYGRGRSESHLGMNINGKAEDIIIATKFMPFPWRITKGELRSALVNSLKRLGLPYVDLYQMHWPFPPVSISTWMEAMSNAFSDGLIRAVGVSNYSVQQVKNAQEALAKYGIPLASNQVKYSLLDKRPENNGLTEYCRKTGVTIIAYSPLEKGILTGKYTPDNLPTGFRAWRYNRTFIEKIEPLLSEIKDIGKLCGGRTMSQVALNWLMAKGALPIPGARDVNQARDNAGAMGWQMTVEQVARLDNISNNILR